MGAGNNNFSGWELCGFELASELGNAHAHALFDRLKVGRSERGSSPVRDFGAYSVAFDDRVLASGESLDAAPGASLLRRC